MELCGKREAAPQKAWEAHHLHFVLAMHFSVHLQLLQQATSSSNLGAFSGIQQMAGKSQGLAFDLVAVV